MTNFSFVKNSEVIVGVDEKHNDNNGAFCLVWLFDEQANCLRRVTVSGTKYPEYLGATFDVVDNAEIISKAREAYRKTEKDCSYRVSIGTETYTDCLVVLKRSRKAPNKTPLRVIGYKEGGFNNCFGTYETPQIQVKDAKGVLYLTSVKTISEVLEGKNPCW